MRVSSKLKLGSDWWIYAFILLLQFYFVVFRGKICMDDTASYVLAWDENISHGMLDKFRTPLYPAFLGILKICFGEKIFLEVAMVLQHIVTLISLVYVKRMLSWMTRSELLVNLLTLLYGIYVFGWSNYIMTEPFAFVGEVFLLYCMFLFFKTGKASYTAWATLWLILLLLLRPAFLYLIPACGLAWILFYKRQGKKVLYGLAGLVVACGMEVGYCAAFKAEFGIFAPSRVSNINNLHIAIYGELLKPEYTDIKEFQEDIRQMSTYKDLTIEDLWLTKVQDTAAEKYGEAEVARVLSKSRMDQPLGWLKAMKSHIDKGREESFPCSWGSPFCALFVGTLSVLTFLFKIYLLFFVLWIIRNRRIPIIATFITVTAIGNLFTVYFAAQSEWSRLLCPSIILFIMMTAQLLNFVDFKALISHKENEIDIK